jgi:hypothetical protein
VLPGIFRNIAIVQAFWLDGSGAKWRPVCYSCAQIGIHDSGLNDSPMILDVHFKDAIHLRKS